MPKQFRGTIILILPNINNNEFRRQYRQRHINGEKTVDQRGAAWTSRGTEDGVVGMILSQWLSSSARLLSERTLLISLQDSRCNGLHTASIGAKKGRGRPWGGRGAYLWLRVLRSVAEGNSSYTTRPPSDDVDGLLFRGSVVASPKPTMSRGFHTGEPRSLTSGGW